MRIEGGMGAAVLVGVAVVTGAAISGVGAIAGAGRPPTSEAFVMATGADLIDQTGAAEQAGAEEEKRAFSELFDKTDVMIAMRDGVKLHTEIYSPKEVAKSLAAGAAGGGGEKLPLFLTRTPYGMSDDDAGYSRHLGLYREMFADGYIFVMQDIRGRYASEGTFVMGRAPRDQKDAKSIDEGTDTYDTIDWLVKNVPGNNGRVG